MSKDVRVLHVVLSLNPGGTERLVIELSRRLRERVATAVCCLDQHGDWADELIRLGIPVHALGRRGGFRPSLARRLADVARSERATVLHCHHYTPFVYGALSTWWWPARVIFTEHGRLHGQEASAKRRIANAVLARRSSITCAVSGDLKQHLVKEGFAGERVRIVYNGIELGPIPTPDVRRRARAALGVREGEAIIGAVGRLDPVKDLPTLIRAFKTIAEAHPAVRLIVIGDGPERQTLEHLIVEERLQDRVTMTGYREDARAVVPAFDVYVNSSTFEGVSLTILEAMASALPVVATRVGGTPEVIDDASGILVPQRDSNALARALRDVLASEPARTALGTAARARVERQFAIERMVNDYAAMYAHTEADLCAA